MRSSAVLALIVVVWFCPILAREPRLKDVVSHVEAYLTTYEGELATLVAEEEYEQSVRSTSTPQPIRRTLTSDFGFLRLPGRREWLGLRDTFAVDGQPVSDHRGRLDSLFAEGSFDREALARRIVDENARYNLGLVARTINVPMLALDLLGPRNYDRVSFRKRGEEDLDGRTVWTITFDERDRPTLVKTPDGHNRPAHGTIWIDPEEGAVLRTQIVFDRGSGDAPAASITVSYRREPALGLLVPYEMREVYRMERGGEPLEEIDAVARYSKFRRFGTTARIVPR
jgi:hypothetical protein